MLRLEDINPWRISARAAAIVIVIPEKRNRERFSSFARPFLAELIISEFEMD
jgi:hypothetical protein